MIDRKQEEMTRLSLLGLAPLAIGAAVVWLPFPGSFAFDLGWIALIYAGVSAGYRAGMGAGSILAGKSNEPFLPSLVAAAVAWFAIWPIGAFYIHVHDIIRYLLLIGVFAYLLMRDLRAVATGQFPAWYGALRTRITFWTCISLALMGVRTLV